MTVTFRADARSSAARRSPRPISWRVARATRTAYVLSTTARNVGSCPGVLNHRDPVTTSHLPCSNPGSVDHMVKEDDMTLDNEQIIGRVTP